MSKNQSLGNNLTMTKEQMIALVDRQLHAYKKHDIEDFVTGDKAFPYGLHSTVIYGFRDELIDRVWFAR